MLVVETIAKIRRAYIAGLRERGAEGFGAVGVRVGGGDFSAALVRGDAGALGLGFLGKGGFEAGLIELFFGLPRFQAGRQIKAEPVGQIAGTIHQPAPVVGKRDRLHRCNIDARPDDVAMFAATATSSG